MSKTSSGAECVKVLCASFGYRIISQRGSHVKLRASNNGYTTTVIVPLHRELAKGTLRQFCGWRGLIRQILKQRNDMRTRTLTKTAEYGSLLSLPGFPGTDVP